MRFILELVVDALRRSLSSQHKTIFCRGLAVGFGSRRTTKRLAMNQCPKGGPFEPVFYFRSERTSNYRISKVNPFRIL
jgi:hypothetical protein